MRIVYILANLKIVLHNDVLLFGVSNEMIVLGASSHDLEIKKEKVSGWEEGKGKEILKKGIFKFMIIIS